jgi:predicted O-methyltransferase YrrM
LAAAAEVHFREMGLSQIQVINQTFDEALPVLIKDLQPGALIFIDGNHTREATLRYFNTFSQVPGIRPIIILDDVNWSEEMQEGWKTIYSGIREGLCIDLFHMGIYFSEPSQIPHFIRMNY